MVGTKLPLPQQKQVLSLPIRSASSQQTFLSLGSGWAHTGHLKLEVNRPDPSPAIAETQAEKQILAMLGKKGWRSQRRGSSQPPAVREGFLGVVTQEFTVKNEGGSWPRRG